MSRIQHIMPSLSEGMSYPAVVGSEGQERARNFYGPSLERLLRLKKQFDPDNRFRAPYGLFDVSAGTSGRMAPPAGGVSVLF
ncbi:BBE domain-containing protein [Klebsiella pneumoniae]